MNQNQIQDARAFLKQYFGYEDFREGQSALIEAVLDGRDVMGQVLLEL